VNVSVAVENADTLSPAGRKSASGTARRVRARSVHVAVLAIAAATAALLLFAPPAPGEPLWLAIVAGAALAFGGGLSLLVASAARTTQGLDPRQIEPVYQAVLHAVRDGVLVSDRDGRLLLANDEARRLLGIPEHAEGHLLARSVPNGTLRALLASQRSTRDEPHLVGDRVLIVNQSEASVKNRIVGVVSTCRDRTELESLLRELDTVRSFADSLRAQAHETANRLQTMVGLVELERYAEAVEFATEEVAVAQELLSRLQDRVHAPPLVALLLGKSASSRERGIELEISGSTFAAPGVAAQDLVTIVGNLVDNAFDAVADVGSPRVEVRLESARDQARIEVRDNGPGVPSYRVFEVGWTTKSATHGARGFGLALVRQTVTRLGGSISMRNDHGAVFGVTLPLSRAASERPTAAMTT
jgi:two-component system, CitB family, sensor kinase